jgi:hypothetical protein
MLRHVGWTAVCAGLVVISTTTAKGQHIDRFDDLECATQRLHEAMRYFEVVACRRRLPTCDRNFIQLTVRQSCRLAESARCGCGSYGRVLSDFTVLRMYMESVDRRLHMNCDLRGDRELWAAWDHVIHDFRDVQCLLGRGQVAHPRSRHFGEPSIGGASLRLPNLGLQLHVD